MLHFDTISPEMRGIASVIHRELDAGYYLAGGTALALLIGHRESVDLDYFLAQSINTEKLKAKLLGLFPGVTFTYEDVDTLWCQIDGVKVSFITRLAALAEPLRDKDEFRIASVSDLVVMKLNAVCGRDEYKDYYDLAQLSVITDVRTWPTLWAQVYPESDPIAWMVALAHVSETVEVPLQGKKLQTRQEIEMRLDMIVKELSPFVGK
ncbi:MAG: nucleotidyl transferase AbiEii/AbiGii toxin family protein [Candidatus Moraniibacteriota bacterium]